MNAKYEKTLEQVFKNPVPANIKWRDIETMLVSLGANIEERSGSRIIVELNGEAQVFHRPHPSPETKRGVVVAIRRFLEGAGVR